MAQLFAKQKCFLVIDADIVTKIIMDLLLMPFEGGQDVLDDEEDDSASGVAILPEGDGDSSDEPTENMTKLYATFLEKRRRILKMFVYTAEDDVDTVKVNSVLKLNMVTKLVARFGGVSFVCQASKLYQTIE